jgi:hypothetical protein
MNEREQRARDDDVADGRQAKNNDAPLSSSFCSSLPHGIFSRVSLVHQPLRTPVSVSVVLEGEERSSFAYLEQTLCRSVEMSPA